MVTGGIIKKYKACSLMLIVFSLFFLKHSEAQQKNKSTREHICINTNWKFYKYESLDKADKLIYDVRPNVNEDLDNRAADAKPTEAVKLEATIPILKSFILPTGNAFIKESSKRFVRPNENPGIDFPFVQDKFNDSAWKNIDLPHDWAISGPFYKGYNTIIGGGMGRLPIQGVAWYRRKIDVSANDKGKSIFLDVDGAMSYSMVWINGHLAGGWPYGYTSWRVNLTPYIKYGGINQLAIRLDNPVNSSRWYPGGGIYRNVWITKVNPVHIAQSGTSITTSDVSKSSAKINLDVSIDNTSTRKASVIVETNIYLLDETDNIIGTSIPVTSFNQQKLVIGANTSKNITAAVSITNPKLWYPLPSISHNRYVAVTKVLSSGKLIDEYETHFGIRDIKFNPDKGILINGEKVVVNGVNQHSDLGPLGMAFNLRAAERQLEKLQDLGCNAIRMAHNPPTPELLDLTDKMGFLVVDEIFDAWERKKTGLDFHLVFPDWSEQDLRALIRRDKNHPSVILWSIGNEVGEQYTGTEGAKVAQRLYTIAKDEDPSRPATLSMNYSKPDMPLPAISDVICLNYQGEGIRNGPAYSGLKGINTPPLFPAFHQKFPNKVILSSENAAALSSRGEYFFPVFNGNSSPIKDTLGGDPKRKQVSSYELYSVDFGSSADKVFATMEQHPFVAGSFVWSGWDYLGEPTPYYLSKSSYFGIIDLAGFQKDRYYLYQSQWRPNLPIAHILPHWNWPERVGLVTPVHVFTSGDEAELFLNGKSLGRKKKAQFEYRLRWDSVLYEPGILKVISYKNNKKWADDSIKTTGQAVALQLVADRTTIKADGKDLSFVTVKVVDENGLMVPKSMNALRFSIDGPAEIVATDNGDPTNLVLFTSTTKEAFNGLCLVIIRGKPLQSGSITLKVESAGLKTEVLSLKSINLN